MVAAWAMVAPWRGLTTVASMAASLPPAQFGTRTSAGRLSSPGRRNLPSLVGPSPAATACQRERLGGGAILLPSSIQVTESISGSVVPLAMFFLIPCIPDTYLDPTYKSSGARSGDGSQPLHHSGSYLGFAQHQQNPGDQISFSEFEPFFCFSFPRSMQKTTKSRGWNFYGKSINKSSVSVCITNHCDNRYILHCKLQFLSPCPTP